VRVARRQQTNEIPSRRFLKNQPRENSHEDGSKYVLCSLCLTLSHFIRCYLLFKERFKLALIVFLTESILSILILFSLSPPRALSPTHWLGQRLLELACGDGSLCLKFSLTLAPSPRGEFLPREQHYCCCCASQTKNMFISLFVRGDSVREKSSPEVYEVSNFGTRSSFSRFRRWLFMTRRQLFVCLRLSLSRTLLVSASLRYDHWRSLRFG